MFLKNHTQNVVRKLVSDRVRTGPGKPEKPGKLIKFA